MDLTGQLLVSMPAMEDPNFFKTVSLVCSHSSDGAIALVLNRPLELRLPELAQHIEIETHTSTPDTLVRQGGPVALDQLFMLCHPDEIEDDHLPINPVYCLSTSATVFEKMAAGLLHQNFMLFLGYAGWDSGQLEDEIRRNVWLNTPFDAEMLTNTALSDLWQTTVDNMGFDVHALTSESGRA